MGCALLDEASLTGSAFVCMLHFFNGSKASCIYPLDACCLFNHNFYWNFPIILRNGVRTGALSGMVMLWLVKDLQSAMELSDSLRDQLRIGFD